MPLSAQQHRREEPPSAEILQARAEKAARDAGLLFVWFFCFCFFKSHDAKLMFVPRNTVTPTNVSQGQKC